MMSMDLGYVVFAILDNVNDEAI